MSETIKTFLVDPNRLSREGMRRVLSEASFEVVGEGSDLESVDEYLKGGSAPQLILYDQPGDGESLRTDLERLKEWMSDVRIVVLASNLKPELLSQSFAAGADGYLLKDISCEGLLESLRLVLIGEKVFPSSLTSLIVRGVGQFAGGTVTPHLANGQSLSDREIQILQCLVAGNSNKMIANRLQITEATVKVHLKSILRKINASNRTQAAIWAYNHGMGSMKNQGIFGGDTH